MGSKGNQQEIERPTLEQVGEGSIFRVSVDSYFLPQRKDSLYAAHSKLPIRKKDFNKHLETFELKKGDTIQVISQEAPVRNAKNPYILEMKLVVLRESKEKGRKGIVDRFEILTSVGEFIEYMKGGLKCLKLTEKVKQRVEDLLDASKIIHGEFLGMENA